MPWANDAEARRHSSATYGAAWRKASAACLKRDNWRCQLRLPGCQGAASHADHKTPVSQGGTDDLANLQAVCKSCHAIKTAREGGGWRRSAPKDPAVQQRTAW